MSVWSTNSPWLRAEACQSDFFLFTIRLWSSTPITNHAVCKSHSGRMFFFSPADSFQHLPNGHSGIGKRDTKEREDDALFPSHFSILFFPLIVPFTCYASGRETCEVCSYRRCLVWRYWQFSRWKYGDYIEHMSLFHGSPGEILWECCFSVACAIRVVGDARWVMREAITLHTTDGGEYWIQTVNRGEHITGFAY